MTIFGDGDLALSKESDGTIRAAGYKLDTIFEKDLEKAKAELKKINS